MSAQFRPDKSTPANGTQVTLAFDHESAEYLRGNDAYKQALAQAAQYGFGTAALTGDPAVELLDPATDEPIYKFEAGQPTGKWRGYFTFARIP